MRHVLDSVEVLVVSGDLDAAAPAVGTEKELTARVRNFCPVNVNGVIVKAFVQGTRVADPGAVFTLSKRAAISEAYRDALGSGRYDTESHAAFRVDLRILFARLVG